MDMTDAQYLHLIDALEDLVARGYLGKSTRADGKWQYKGTDKARRDPEGMARAFGVLGWEPPGRASECARKTEEEHREDG